MRAADTTEMPNSMIRPTPTERAMGRLMRAPDHGEVDGDNQGGADGGESSEGATEGESESGEGKSLMGDIGEKEGEGEGAKDEGTGDKGKEEGAKEGPPALPEKYELTPPEGLEITPEIVAEIDPVFRELGLNNDKANRLMPLAGALAQRIMKGQADAHEAMGADWAKAAQADERLGGKNWPDTERFVAKAFDTAAAGLGKDGVEQVKAFKALLDDTKLGNHPILLSMFRFYGERISEDTELVRGDAGAQVKPSREAVLYPNDAPKEGAA